MEQQLDKLKKKPIVVVRRPFYVGGSICIPLPPEWFEVHNIKVPIGRNKEKPELIIIADNDIRIANPTLYNKLYSKISKLAKVKELSDKKILKSLEKGVKINE
jgi:hypothetical protein